MTTIKDCDLYWEKMGISVNWTAVTDKGVSFLGTMAHSVNLLEHETMLENAMGAGLRVIEFNPWKELRQGSDDDK